MKERLMCKFFGLHKYEITKEEHLVDAKGHTIGNIIITKCSICGKIKHNKIYLEHGYN